MKKLIAQGIEPSEQKKEEKAVAIGVEREQSMTFEEIARGWYAKKTGHLTPDYQRQIILRLENMIFSHIGRLSAASIEPSDILGAVRHAE